jgi:hypothetical protein
METCLHMLQLNSNNIVGQFGTKQHQFMYQFHLLNGYADVLVVHERKYLLYWHGKRQTILFKDQVQDLHQRGNQIIVFKQFKSMWVK